MQKKTNKQCWESGKSKDCGPGKQPPVIDPLSKHQFKFSIWYFIIFFVILLLLNTFLPHQNAETIKFSEFKQKIISGEITSVVLSDKYYLGTAPDNKSTQGGKIYRTVPVNDPTFVPLMDEHKVAYDAEPVQDNFLLNLLLTWVLPFGIIFLIWRFLFKRVGNLGSNIMTFSQNKAQIVAEGSTGVTFDDVAGIDESKAELAEIVDFLKNPDRYLAIGGKIPKGVLLIGPPGGGKTLLARAVAGEAHVPFFRMSGADFVELFVGVGAARVRDLFKQGREKSPCIIFIDELDAIGKTRVNVAGGNDEREQTLNQLLVEMDGFDATAGVIILGATNRPEILDPALLRPGRFDRQVLVDRPDMQGREAILRIHARNVKLADSVDLKRIAVITPGFVGADLANIVNEAALLAVRNNRNEVLQNDLEEAIEKVIAGLQKKNRLINSKEKEIVAYHETGHALVAAFTPGSDTVQKISIVPRGMNALGYTLQYPTEDRYLMTKDELLGKIDVLLGGRAAEEIVFNKVSTGAVNDLSQATEIARKMIVEYGMSEKFRNVTLPAKRPALFLGETTGGGIMREYSESTQQYIDEAISEIINERYNNSLQIIRKNETKLKSIAARLLEKETISAEEFQEFIKAE